MKNLKYLPLFLLSIIALATGCQGEMNNNNETTIDLLGHWTSEIAAEEGFSEERRALANQMMGGMMNFHFQPGNKLTSSAAGYQTKGTYEQVGNKLKLSFEDDSELELIIAGSNLLWEQPELTMSFSKGEAPSNTAHPLGKAVMDRLSTSKSDPLQGIWELKSVNNSSGQALYALQELEEGVLLSFHHDGTYTKHMTAQRKVDGTYAKSGSNIVLKSDLGSTKTYVVTKVTSKELQLKENGSDIVRAYVSLGAE